MLASPASAAEKTH